MRVFRLRLSPPLMRREPLRPVDDNVYQASGTTGASTGPSKRAVPAEELSDEEKMAAWRRRWRQILSSSAVYFDKIDPQVVDTLTAYLNLLGTQVAPFLSNKVTHVISNRSESESEAVRHARASQLKIYTAEKLERFLGSVLGYPLTKQLDESQHTHLAQLLNQERLQGRPLDRDPDARRDDYYYFRGPYVMLFDPQQYYKVMLHKEWPRPTRNDDRAWPQLHVSHSGTCPFVRPSQAMAPSRAVKRASISEGPGGKRQRSGASARPALAERTMSIVNQQRPWITAGEIQASGIQRNSQTSAVKSMVNQSGGNGLDGPRATASREVANLQRKVLPQAAVARPSVSMRKKGRQAGYCENCQERYGDFTEHIESRSHRKFARDASNFLQLDGVIQILQRQPLSYEPTSES